jgi:hypothetical protein
VVLDDVGNSRATDTAAIAHHPSLPLPAIARSFEQELAENRGHRLGRSPRRSGHGLPPLGRFDGRRVDRPCDIRATYLL